MHYDAPTAPNPDANLAAGKLAKTLENPTNLGIGTLPGHSYQPIPPSTLKAGRDFLLSFLGLEDQLINLVPSKGGGSGAIATGLAAVRAMGYQFNSLSFSAWDWAGYESFCAAQGVVKNYLAGNSYDCDDPETLILTQTNRNGVGTRLSLGEAEALIEQNNQHQRPNFVDLPYFTGTDEEKAILHLFQTNAEQPTIIAWSPTKIFQTFGPRPGGVTLILWPNEKMATDLAWVAPAVARGTTGFDDAVTRELWEEMAHSQNELGHRHEHYLAVINTATDLWRKNAPDNAQNYFDDTQYGGMFRLFPAEADTQQKLAEKNIVAVLMQSGDEYRIRVNICGIIQSDGTATANAEQVVQDFFAVLDL